MFDTGDSASTAPQQATGLDNEGNSLEDPIIIAEPEPQTGDQNQDITLQVDIPTYDIDIYQLPQSLAGESITISFSNTTIRGAECGRCPFRDTSWTNSLFLGDSMGRSIPYTTGIDGNSLTATIPQSATGSPGTNGDPATGSSTENRENPLRAYIVFIGGGIQFRDAGNSRSTSDGQFTITIGVN